MALFFDQQWFSGRLAELGRTPNELAEAMGLPLVDLAAIWKDQRELSPDEVRSMAVFLETPVEDVATHAGVSTPIPPDTHSIPDLGDATAVLARLDDIAHRLEKLERAVADVKSLVLETRFAQSMPDTDKGHADG